MATLDYVEIPPYALRLQSSSSGSGAPTSLRAAPKITTSLPRPSSAAFEPLALALGPGGPPASTPGAGVSVGSPTSPRAGSAFNLPSLLLSSSLPLPSGSTNPRAGAGTGTALLTTRDPLSIPITTTNFRRFVARVGPVFWLQDRIEEVVLWRRGWRVTGVWMAAYAFICYFPRLVLLVPHALLLAVLLVTHPSGTIEGSASDAVVPPLPPLQPGEGSVDWLANLQAIQNLMGAVSDGHDALVPLLPHVTNRSPISRILLTATFLSALLLLPLIYILPLRPTFLFLGLFPFALTHPRTRATAPALLPFLLRWARAHRLPARAVRAADDDRLEDKHWRAERREVELWENERWVPAGAGVAAAPSGLDDVHVHAAGALDGEGGAGGAGGSWGKTGLRAGERAPWTRGRDGWSGVGADGSGDVSSNLTFSLAPGWAFVETEDWRADTEAAWSAGAGGGDECGWVYSNDAWMDARPRPREEWAAGGGMTRRRRWVRRIYFDPALAEATHA